MEVIEFRGKDILNGNWLFGNYFNDGGEEYIIPQDLLSIKSYEDYQVDPNTVGQYTGLKDKNDKKIYKGDIVECVSWNEYFSKDGQTMEPFRRKMYVDFRKGGFKMVEPMPEPMRDNEWDIIFNGDIVIIGNIHDNPELLDK